MKSNYKIIHSKEAVSPVIGVMLMIVVVVILAAAVSSFAGSLKNRDKPINAVFDIIASASEGTIKIKHMGGDVIYKEDIKIMVSHGVPKMSGTLDNKYLTFYPSDQQHRDPGMDKTPLSSGQTAIYTFKDAIYPGATAVKKANLAGQVVMVGESFTLSIIDVNTENTIFSKEVIMSP